MQLIAQETATMRYAVLLFGLAVAVVSAQTPALPTSVNIMVLPPTGNANSVGPVRTQWSNVEELGTSCNLDLPGTPVTLNPKFAYFQDPWRPTRWCKAPMPSGIPAGNGYRAVGVFEAPSCQDSATSDPRVPCRSKRSVVAPTTFSVTAWLAPVAPPQNMRLG